MAVNDRHPLTRVRFLKMMMWMVVVVVVVVVVVGMMRTMNMIMMIAMNMTMINNEDDDDGEDSNFESVQIMLMIPPTHVKRQLIRSPTVTDLLPRHLVISKLLLVLLQLQNYYRDTQLSQNAWTPKQTAPPHTITLSDMTATK